MVFYEKESQTHRKLEKWKALYKAMKGKPNQNKTPRGIKPKGSVTERLAVILNVVNLWCNMTYLIHPSFEDFFMELKRNLPRTTKHGSRLM